MTRVHGIVGVNDENGDDEDNGLEIYLEDNVIHISGKGIKCNYITTNLDILKDLMPNPKMLENVRSAQSCVEFTLSNKNIDKIKKVAQLLSLEDVIIRNIAKDETVNIGVANTSILSHNNDSMVLDVEHYKVDSQNNHHVMLNIANLKKIPCADYHCRLLKHAKVPDNYIIHLIPKEIEGVDIVLATKSVPATNQSIVLSFKSLYFSFSLKLL